MPFLPSFFCFLLGVPLNWRTLKCNVIYKFLFFKHFSLLSILKFLPVNKLFVSNFEKKNCKLPSPFYEPRRIACAAKQRLQEKMFQVWPHLQWKKFSHSCNQVVLLLYRCWCCFLYDYRLCFRVANDVVLAVEVVVGVFSYVAVAANVLVLALLLLLSKSVLMVLIATSQYWFDLSLFRLCTVWITWVK